MSEKFFVYILISEKDRTRYVGMSQNPQRRLYEHNAGFSKYTKGKRPFKLMYQEMHESHQSAREKEKYFKSGSGREFSKSLFPCSSVGRAIGC